MGQIEDMRLFALVVENRSISRAAEKLHIAKSAVSRRLQLLENRLGSRLIDRERGAWQVTATGRELYQRVVSVVGDIDEIVSDFTEATQSLAGPLAISVPQDFGVAFLASSLIAFKARYPDIQLSVDFDDRTVDLARENYDFAIRITPEPEGNVIASQIGVSRHTLCASPAYLEANGLPKNLRELGGHPLLYFGTAKRAHWDFIAANGEPHSIEFQPALNTNSGKFLLDATLKGLGIARLPDFISASFTASGRLSQLLPNMIVPEWGIFLLHAENRRLNRRMRLFAEEMKLACMPNSDQIGQ
ncbi:MAG: LysR family transcriptional regulator [Hoeflea sp.]|uniref:LysR family transcriptional regulator n=1 Tax=Hoeflea sp. TaxID=1940281 RepID=UPI003EF6F834